MIPLVFAAVAAVAGFTGAWQIQAMRHDRAISDIRATQAQELATAVGEAHAKTLALQAAKDAAERKARIREAAIARDLAANRDALVSLHGAADQALRHASTTHSACIADANALTVVLGKCAGELQDMGAIADGWYSETITLRESWPK